MRCAVISRGMSLEQVEAEARKVGARDIKGKPRLKQVFCELDEGQLQALSRVPGLKVKPVKEIRPAQIMVPELAAQQEVGLSGAVSIWGLFLELRSLFQPSLTGAGLTVAVLDSGIRASHRSLQGRVAYAADFSGSSGTGDVFGHGTQVAFAVAGCDPQGESGVSPGAKLMNIKVLNDEGVGTDETVVDGIEEVLELVEEAIRNGVHTTDDMFPNVINLSLGSEDDGDPDNPVRVACRSAVEGYGIDVIAAAGNQGPKMSTVMVPACDPQVVGVGAIETVPFTIWSSSSRGPTLEGETKPDFVIWGVDMSMASDEADDEYVTKSGTSFAAPLISGLTGLLWESGRRAYGEFWPFSWTRAREAAPYFSVKPEDAPIRKDNTYGYGLPAAGAMLGEMAGAPGPTEQMAESLPMLAMMMVMIGLVRAV